LGLFVFVLVTSLIANVILQRVFPTRESDRGGRQGAYRILFFPVWLIVALLAGCLIAVVTGERIW
jgi:hypothetical protein